MKCPKCGNPKYRFVEKKMWRERIVGKPETKWFGRLSEDKLCGKCGYKGEEER